MKTVNVFEVGDRVKHHNDILRTFTVNQTDWAEGNQKVYFDNFGWFMAIEFYLVRPETVEPITTRLDDLTTRLGRLEHDHYGGL